METKKEKWDQTKLQELFKLILASGDNPYQYFKLTIDSKQFENWSTVLKEMFESAKIKQNNKAA